MRRCWAARLSSEKQYREVRHTEAQINSTTVTFSSYNMGGANPVHMSFTSASAGASVPLPISEAQS